MATNGISTHSPKNERANLKLQLAQTKRQQLGTNGFRLLNQLGATYPALGRPWKT